MKNPARSKAGIFAAVLAAVFCLTLISAAYATCMADVIFPEDLPPEQGSGSLDVGTVILIAVAVAAIVTAAVVLISVLKKRKNKK